MTSKQPPPKGWVMTQTVGYMPTCQLFPGSDHAKESCPCTNCVSLRSYIEDRNIPKKIADEMWKQHFFRVIKATSSKGGDES